MSDCKNYEIDVSNYDEYDFEEDEGTAIYCSSDDEYDFEEYEDTDDKNTQDSLLHGVDSIIFNIDDNVMTINFPSLNKRQDYDTLTIVKEKQKGTTKQKKVFKTITQNNSTFCLKNTIRKQDDVKIENINITKTENCKNENDYNTIKDFFQTQLNLKKVVLLVNLNLLFQDGKNKDK